MFDGITALHDGSTERDPVEKFVEGFDFRGLGVDILPDFGARYIFEQEQGALHPAQLTKGLVEQAFAIVCAEFSEQHRRYDKARLDREHDLHQITPVARDEPPIDGVRKESVDMVVTRGFSGAVQRDVRPGAHTRHQFGSQHSAETKNRLALPMGVGVQRVGLNDRAVLLHAVKNMYRLPDPARYEGREQGDVGIGNMVIGNGSVVAVTYMARADQVILSQRHVRTIRDRCFSRAH